MSKKIRIGTMLTLAAAFAFASADLYGREAAMPQETKAVKEINGKEAIDQKIKAEVKRKRPMPQVYVVKINFETNSCFLTEEFKRDVRDLVKALGNYDYNKITLIGHSDKGEAKKWNGLLSKQRAIAVYDEFIKAGVDQEKLQYYAFADTMPANSSETEEGRSKNRRTEIVVE